MSLTSLSTSHPDTSPALLDKNREGLLEQSRKLLLGQSRALASLADRLDHNFADAVQTILQRQGRLVVCGMGKSGLVGRKIAATMSSTGTPAFFLHASEALHGDLGMVTCEDTVLMISNSGETDEVLRILTALREMKVPVIAMAGNSLCSLAQLSTVFLEIAIDREACPLNLAPTTSTLVTLALGDALALALSQARGFEANDFARFHPGGSLGRRLCTRVRDVMRKDDLPIVSSDEDMSRIIMAMTQGRCGTAIVMDDGVLIGIITDGDLRRAFQKHAQVMELQASDVMTSNPVVISEDARQGDAEEMMLENRVKALLAVNSRGRVTGILEIFTK